MTIRNSWKRVIAGTLAVLVVAGTVPANLGGGVKLFDTDIVASADSSTITVVSTADELSAALNDSSVSYILFAGDIAIDYRIYFNRDLTIDFNGYTMSYSEPEWTEFPAACKVTLQNGTIKNGKGLGYFCVYGDTAVKLTLKDFNLYSRTCAVRILNSASSVTLDNVYYKSSRGYSFAYDDNQATINGTLRDTPVIFSIQLDKTTLELTYGEDETVTATVSPDDPDDKTVTWASSDESVATVDENGKVTAAGVGTATITATATNGTDDTSDDKTATCTVTVKADKTALNTAITEAETYYNSIKDSNPEAAAALLEAINDAKSVANNDNATQDAVDTAATNITNAKAAAEKDAADQAAADAVTSTINDLPAADDVTTADKADIEAARKAYDALTDDQKAKVTPETLKKLEDAETALAAAEKDAADQAAADAVTSTINDLPAADDVTTADKADIEAARKAYDDLTDDQKAKVTPETLKKLEDAEEALAAAEKEEADKAAAGTVEEKLNNLPDPENVETTDKEIIEAARKAYDELTDDQKAKIPEEALKKLTDDEEALAAAEKEAADQAAADDVTAIIDKLPAAEDVTTDDKAAIEEARKNYDALTEDQKAKVSDETLKKLTDDEEALAAAEKEAADQAAADDVIALIEKLPAAKDVKTTDKAAIEEARKNYDALTEDQKAKVSDETLKKLTDAEAALAAAEKEAADQAAADDVTALIEKLPAAKDVKTADKAAIEAARKAYDALTDEQKAKVSADTLKKLTDAEAALAEAEKKTSDDSSKSDSSKTDSSSNAGTNNGSTTNPATGAAVGMGAASLAAAALIVAKKKDE